MPVHDPRSPQPGPLSDFLHPQSMVTPGLLGALAMAGTNTFCAKFSSLNENEPVVSLVLSLLFGLAAVIRDAPLIQRVVYYVLNTIIIFIVAAGANTVGLASQSVHLSAVSAAYAEEAEAPLAHTQMAAGFFRPWFPSERPSAQPGAPPIKSNNPSGDTGHANPPNHHTGSPPPHTAPPSPPH
jgi:hypothetical protein